MFRRNEISDLWEILLENLKNRRGRLDRSIALQKILQSIILLADSIDETISALELNQSVAMIEGNSDKTFSKPNCYLQHNLPL